MAHKHRVGKKIISRMRRIMKEGMAISKRLPTQEARDAESNDKNEESSPEESDK